MILIDGKKTSADIKNEIKLEVDKIIQANKRPPHLVAVLVGDDPASRSYVNSKEKAAEKIGFKSSILRFSESISEEKLLQEITKLNNDNGVDGYIVQLPLPEHIDAQKVILAIDPSKDVDGFHPMNLGKIITNMPSFLPATPYGILELINRYEIKTEGENVLVIGRSLIVGRPLSILLSQKRKGGNATVTVAHSRTKNLKNLALQADIIIVAIGSAHFLTADMVNEGVVIIDAGINSIDAPERKRGYKLVGDVDFENVSKKASYITPVPGGVGPMTIAMLLKNTLLAYQNSQN
jgi:methylenetetrahydrofolate dehydrogenase (NADP+)/methenyltetrahydrofolate cyclohydrolase